MYMAAYKGDEKLFKRLKGDLDESLLTNIQKHTLQLFPAFKEGKTKKKDLLSLRKIDKSGFSEEK